MRIGIHIHTPPPCTTGLTAELRSDRDTMHRYAHPVLADCACPVCVVCDMSISRASLCVSVSVHVSMCMHPCGHVGSATCLYHPTHLYADAYYSPPCPLLVMCHAYD